MILPDVLLKLLSECNTKILFQFVVDTRGYCYCWLVEGTCINICINAHALIMNAHLFLFAKYNLHNFQQKLFQLSACSLPKVVSLVNTIVYDNEKLFFCFFFGKHKVSMEKVVVFYTLTCEFYLRIK